MPLIYVAPNFCEAEFSSTSEPIIVLTPIRRRSGPTGLVVTDDGGITTLSWGTVDGAICYNVYAVLNPGDANQSYVLVAECITDPNIILDPGTYVVTVITLDGESDPSDQVVVPGAQIPCPQTGPEVPQLPDLPGESFTWKLVSLSEAPRDLVSESWNESPIMVGTVNWDGIFDGPGAADIANPPDYNFIARFAPADSIVGTNGLSGKEVQVIELSGPWLGEELRDRIDADVAAGGGSPTFGTDLVTAGELIIGKRYWIVAFQDCNHPACDPDTYGWFGVKEYGPDPVGNYRKLFAAKPTATSCLQVENT